MKMKMKQTKQFNKKLRTKHQEQCAEKPPGASSSQAQM